ncbi:hypothetical protein LINGRAPRIM_LOCUS3249 [Linum grandiflorum]
MIDGNPLEKALKTRRWGVVGRDGSRVLLELDEYGVPIGEEGCFLRQVNGKIVKNQKFDIGAKNWHKVTDTQKDHVFDNHIRVRLQLIEFGFQLIPFLHKLGFQLIHIWVHARVYSWIHKTYLYTWPKRKWITELDYCNQSYTWSKQYICLMD